MAFLIQAFALLSEPQCCCFTTTLLHSGRTLHWDAPKNHHGLGTAFCLTLPHWLRNNSWVTRTPAHSHWGRRKAEDCALPLGTGSRSTVSGMGSLLGACTSRALYNMFFRTVPLSWLGCLHIFLPRKNWTVPEIKGTDNPLGTNDYICHSEAQMISI